MTAPVTDADFVMLGEKVTGAMRELLQENPRLAELDYDSVLLLYLAGVTVGIDVARTVISG